MPAVEHICAPVAQSVSAPYLYSSIRPKLCGGCEFEPHLEHGILFFSIDFRNQFRFEPASVCLASIAQWLEHWSRKPGVVSSILTGGCALFEIVGEKVHSSTFDFIRWRETIFLSRIRQKMI